MRSEDRTEIGGVQGAFLTTHWSLIDRIGSHEDRDKDRALIGLLLKRYWKPVYCYLRRRGYGNEDAKDLTQGFFHEIVLGRKLIEKADRTKGRFRSYLLVALNNYLATVHAAETAQKRIPKDKLVPLNVGQTPDCCAVTRDYTPEESFDYAWVSNLLEHVLEELETTCYEDGKAVYWRVFRDRVLKPIMEEQEPISLTEICHKYDIESTRVASNMIVTVKRRFQSILLKQLRETVVSDGQVDDELVEISRFLPRLAQSGK